MLQVAFYKGPGKFVDWLIRFWTRSNYSHCEILFPDEVMFSADAWTNRVRYTHYFDKANWDFVPIDVPEGSVWALREWCNARVGKEYDWWGVVRFVLPFVKQDPTKWFCSELCGAGLKFIGVVPVPTKTSKLSPKDLHKVLEAALGSKE